LAKLPEDDCHFFLGHLPMDDHHFGYKLKKIVKKKKLLPGTLPNKIMSIETGLTIL
jgi:hypothetical protein